MAERRIVAISHKATAGDQQLLALMWPFALMALNSESRLGRFAGMSSRDIDRVMTMAAEELCDRTVRLMGEWR